MPVEEASVSAVDLGYEKPLISQLPNLVGVAERVSRVVQLAILALNIWQIRHC
jgi:hypothetical protein